MSVYTKAHVNKHPANLNVLCSSQKSFTYDTDSHFMLLTTYGVDIILHTRKFSLCVAKQQGHIVKLTRVLHFREKTFFFYFYLLTLFTNLFHTYPSIPLSHLWQSAICSMDLWAWYLFFDLFVCLDSTHYRDHMAFFFLCLTYFT